MATKSNNRAPARGKGKGRTNLPARREEKKALATTFNGIFEEQGGFDIGATDMAIPFLKVAQKLSPELDDESPRYMEGLQEGDIFNSVTGEIWGGAEGVRFVACSFQRSVIEWIPRDKGGGFVAQHDVASRGAAEQLRVQDDTELVDTMNYFVLAETTDGDWSPAILSMTSTKLKVARKWNAALRNNVYTAPDGRRANANNRGRVWTLTTIKERNDKGSFFNYIIVEDGWLLDWDDQEAAAGVYNLANELYNQVKAGIAKADWQSGSEETVVEAEEEDLPGF